MIKISKIDVAGDPRKILPPSSLIVIRIGTRFFIFGHYHFIEELKCRIKDYEDFENGKSAVM